MFIYISEFWLGFGIGLVCGITLVIAAFLLILRNAEKNSG